MTAVVVALFVLDPNAPVAVLLRALGEALLVGLCVGAAVDLVSRRNFAREVGRNVFLSLFGRDVPERFVTGLQRTLRADRLSYEVDTEVTFSWHRKNELLRLDLVHRGTSENVSDRSWRYGDLWIMRSVLGAPESRIYFYEGSSFAKDRSGQRVGHLTLNEQEILERARQSEDGSKTIPLRDFRLSPEVPPGGVLSYTMRGDTYQHASGVLPIINGSPVLRHQVVLTGPALEDLNVGVRRGMQVIAARPAGDQLLYVIDDLTLGGMTILVQWQPRE